MKIAIIGCGHMGMALAQRLVKDNQLVITSRNHEKGETFVKTIGAAYVKEVNEAIRSSEAIILAVKPQNFEEIATQIKTELRANQLLISTLTSVSLNVLKNHFEKTAVVRIMPNIAVTYGKGVIGIVENTALSEKNRIDMEAICQVLGAYYWLPEDKIDALTALTGSGPAFVFVMIEAMVEAAIALGFTAKQGQEFVLEMVEGAIVMLRESNKHPADLKWMVASPGGTTIAGLNKMEEEKVRNGIIQAFIAAKNRAKTISDSK